jgi:acetylornithine deacetylase/succinyl-diaminopimelate desuccinylase-like protein
MGKGSTDANIPLSLGVPAVTFGLYSGDGEHTRGEWLRIDSLKPGLEIGLSLVLKRCF